MKIHAIQTGTVALTTSWREGVGHGRRRLMNALLDRDWTEPLPIYRSSNASESGRATSAGSS